MAKKTNRIHFISNQELYYDQQEPVDGCSDFGDTTMYKSEVIEYLCLSLLLKRFCNLQMVQSIVLCLIICFTVMLSLCTSCNVLLL